MFRRLRLYTIRSGYLKKGQIFRAYLFGHEFMVIGDVAVMKKMMTQVRRALGGGEGWAMKKMMTQVRRAREGKGEKQVATVGHHVGLIKFQGNSSNSGI